MIVTHQLDCFLLQLDRFTSNAGKSKKSDKKLEKREPSTEAIALNAVASKLSEHELVTLFEKMLVCIDTLSNVFILCSVAYFCRAVSLVGSGSSSVRKGIVI